MKASILAKLEYLSERHEELAALLSSPDIVKNQDKFRSYSKEYSDLEPLVKTFKQYTDISNHIESATELLKDSDSDMRNMAADDIRTSKQQQDELSEQLKILLLPKDPNDTCNVFLEIRAAAGGDESAIFAGTVCRKKALED